MAGRTLKELGHWNLNEIPLFVRAWWELPVCTFLCFPTMNCSRHHCLPTQNQLLFPHPPTFLINRTLAVFRYWLLFHALLSVRTHWPQGQSQGSLRFGKVSPFLRGRQWKRCAFLPLDISELLVTCRRAGPHHSQCEKEDKPRMTQERCRMNLGSWKHPGEAELITLETSIIWDLLFFDTNTYSCIHIRIYVHTYEAIWVRVSITCS